MKRMAASCLLLCLAASAAAQPTPLPRYKVVRDSSAKGAAEEWNAAAGQGYRLLFESRLAVMRLDAAPPDTYRYVPLPARALRNTFLNALNEQGAFGYGWLKGTRMLEKLPHPHVYEYTIVEGFAVATRALSRQSLFAQGFTSVGRFVTVPIFMRDTTIDPQSAASAQDVRMLDRLAPGRLFKAITSVATEGYRYRGVEFTEGGIQVAMEPCDAACGGPFEYRSFDVKNAAQLERTLNDRSRQGFYLVRESLDWPPHVVERGSSRRTLHYSYRVAAARDAAAVEKFLNDSDRDGFAAVSFVSHVGWNVGLYIVVEKATAWAP